ncbi:hypothetical protein [Psychrobacter sp. PG1]|uniref:hypothetical protein n=1 Tax=unclassified Psychrobacter TaxID=196806 RepID=UPI0018673FDB|nr:hypothetical protein [Psychrobacter sp. PG1]
MTNLTTALTLLKKLMGKKQNVKTLDDIQPQVINDDLYTISANEAQDEKMANYFEKTPVSKLCITVCIPLLVTIPVVVIAGSPEMAKQLAQSKLKSIFEKNTSLEFFSVLYASAFDHPRKNGIIYNYDVCVRSLEFIKIKGFEKHIAIDMAINNLLDSELYLNLSSNFEVAMPSYLDIYHQSNYNLTLS